MDRPLELDPLVPESERSPGAGDDEGASSSRRAAPIAHRAAPAEPSPAEIEPLRFRASDPLGTKRLEGAPSAPRSSPPSGPSSLDPQRLGAGHLQPVAHLSPRMTAVFGALFGLATVASIIALLIQGVPPTSDAEITDHAAAAETVEPVAIEPPAPPTLESRKPERVALPSPWRVTDLEKEQGAAIRIVKGTIDRRAFVKALQEEGVPKKEVYRILKAFEGVRSFDKTGRNDAFIVALDRGDKRVRAFEYVVSSLEIFQAKEDDAGLLRAEQLDMKIAEAEVVAAFYIGADLERSYRWAGLEPGILDEINEALNGRLSTESFEEGGVVRLVATEMTALGLFADYKSIVALEYRPPDGSKEEPVRTYSFVGEKSKGYFDEKGRQPFTGGWRSPVPGAPITSHFNPKRLHPILKKPMPHNGTDYGAPSGTPVYSAYRGTVDFVGNSGASGNLVLITHPNGVQTGYAHLSKFAAGINKGDKVGTHELIGYVGSTGRSTGPHLHFSAKRDGKFFDATTLRMDGVRVLPTIDRPAFLARKAELDVRLDGIPLPEPAPEPPAAKAEEPATAGSEAEATADGAPPESSEAAESSDSRPERTEDADAAQEGILRGADLGN